MLSNIAESTEERVLVYSPTERDAETTANALSDAGLDSRACLTLDSLLREIETGAGALLLTAEEGSAQPSLPALRAVLDRQESWSDLPLILLIPSGPTPQTMLAALHSYGALLLLEHPAPMSTLVSAARTALHARRCQYQVRDLQQSLETVHRQNNQFLALLAHELRNPLAPMSNAVQLMRMRGEPDPATARFRDVVERQVLQMQRLVNDLLDVSRLTRGMIELHRARLDLSYVVQQAVEDHRNELAAAGLAVHMELPVEPVWVDGDATRLTQVLGNLLHNSVKSAPDGGQVTVRLQVEDGGSGSASGPSASPDGWATLSVRDTGIVIEPGILPHIFDCFAQAGHSLDGGSGGLGLGLTLARQLVELHGGQISATSEGPEHGTEFTLRLPLIARAAEAMGKQAV